MSTLQARLRSLLVVATILLGASRADAAYDMFMQIPEAPGESTESKHVGWIDVSSYNDTVSGPSRGFSFSMPSIRSFPKLIAAASTGQILKLVTLEMRKAGTTQLVFLNVKFENVRIANVSTSTTSGTPLPLVTVSFACERATWTYTPSKPDGSADTPIVTLVDFRTPGPAVVLPEIPRYKL